MGPEAEVEAEPEPFFCSYGQLELEQLETVIRLRVEGSTTSRRVLKYGVSKDSGVIRTM